MNSSDVRERSADRAIEAKWRTGEEGGGTAAYSRERKRGGGT